MILLHKTNTELDSSFDILRLLPIVVITLFGFCWLFKKKWLHSIVGNSLLFVAVICQYFTIFFKSELFLLILIYYPLVLGGAIFITLSNHFLGSNRKSIPNKQGFLSANNYVRFPSILLFLFLMMLFGYFVSVDGSEGPLRFQIGLFILLNLSLLLIIRYNKEKIVHVWIGIVYVCISCLFLFYVFPKIKIVDLFSFHSDSRYGFFLLLFAGLSLILLPNLKIYLGHNQEFFRIRKGPYEQFPIKFSSFQVLSDLEIQELEKQDLSNLSIQALSLLTIKPQELPLQEDGEEQEDEDELPEDGNDEEEETMELDYSYNIIQDNDFLEWKELIKQGKGFIGPDRMGYSYQPLLIHQPIITWDRGQNTFRSNTETVLLYCFDAKLKIKWMHKVPQEKDCKITFKNCLFDQKSNVYFILMKDQAVLIYSFTSEGNIRWNKEYTL